MAWLTILLDADIVFTMALGGGALVTQNVRLVELLAEGGMGSVWIAHHETLDTNVAVKFINAGASGYHPAQFARFQREARTTARLNSPHVVQVFDYGIADDGSPYMVMELLQGYTLGEWLALGEPLSIRDIGLVVTQTAKVLAEAHKKGIVHRDIKPDNLFLVDAHNEPFVKVLDFGLAKPLERRLDGNEITVAGAVLGTPECMSPEQICGSSAVGYRTDLWALAVSAYWALTGRNPFDGDNLVELREAICRGAFTPVAEAREGLPPMFDAWCERAFAPEPANRFDSAQDLASSFIYLLSRWGEQCTAESTAEDEAPASRPDPLAKTAPGSPPGPPSDLAGSPSTHTDEEPTLPKRREFWDQLESAVREQLPANDETPPAYPSERDPVVVAPLVDMAGEYDFLDTDDDELPTRVSRPVINGRPAFNDMDEEDVPTRVSRPRDHTDSVRAPVSAPAPPGRDALAYARERLEALGLSWRDLDRGRQRRWFSERWGALVRSLRSAVRWPLPDRRRPMAALATLAAASAALYLMLGGGDEETSTAADRTLVPTLGHLGAAPVPRPPGYRARGGESRSPLATTVASAAPPTRPVGKVVYWGKPQGESESSATEGADVAAPATHPTTSPPAADDEDPYAALESESPPAPTNQPAEDEQPPPEPPQPAEAHSGRNIKTDL